MPATIRIRTRLAVAAWIICLSFGIMALTCTLGATLAHASGAPLHATTPSWVGVVKAHATVHVPKRYVGSDLQCFSTRTGMPYVQRMGTLGPKWTGTKGSPVARWDRSTGDYISSASFSVICASWAE